MIVCPLCEHRQERGYFCDVCGRDLSQGRSDARAVAVLPGLEVTALGGGEAAVQPLPGLERHRVDDDLRATRPPSTSTNATAFQPPAGEPQTLDALVARLFEEEAASRTDRGTASAARPEERQPCRSCGHVQQGAGPMCERCGVRLAIPLAAEDAADPGTSRRCSECGVRVRPTYERCPSCGTRMR